MNRVYILLIVACFLSNCAWQPGPSNVEQQVAVWKWQEATQDAANDAEALRRHDQLARDVPIQDAAERHEAAHFAAAVRVQQAAVATKRTAMLACLASQEHRFAALSTLPVTLAANAVIVACRPEIDAVAHTVEMARLTSGGLAADMAARLRPGIIRAVARSRQGNGNRAYDVKADSASF